MKKIVFGQKNKKPIITKKVYELNVEQPYAPGPLSLNKKDERVATDFSQLQDLNSFDSIKHLLSITTKQKSKVTVQKSLREITEAMKKFAEELDEIGIGSSSRKIHKGIIPSINNLLVELDNLSPKEFSSRFNNIRQAFEKLDPKVQTSEELTVFDSIPDIFKNMKYKQVKVSDKTPAEIITAPILFYFYRKLSDKARALLEKQLDCKFAPYTGAMLFEKAPFLIVNKNKFSNSNKKSITTSILSAISKDGSIIPLFDILYESDNYFAVFCTRSQYLRTMTEVIEAANNIQIFLK